MSSSYCANYYGSINCHNTVTRFGDRCKLCLALKSGASLSQGLLPEDETYRVPTMADYPRRHHYRSGPEHANRTVTVDSRAK